MKKLVCFILMAVLMLTACKKESFEQTVHQRSETYGVLFDMMVRTEENLTVGIEKKIWNEKQGGDYFKIIQEDYDRLLKAGGDKSADVKIYIVNQTIYGKPQIEDHVVYCTKADIENLSYRQYLTQAVFGLKKLWQQQGLSTYIFEESVPKSEEDIRKYCENEENKNILSLIPPYFCEAFAKDEQLEIARSAAAFLTKYTIENFGIENYLKYESYEEILEPWFKAIGLKNFDHEVYCIQDCIQDTDMSGEYPLIMTVDNFQFYLEPKQWAENADMLYHFFYRNMAGMEKMKSRLLSEGMGDYLEAFESKKIDVYIDELYSRAHGSAIYIEREADFCHEVMHIIAFGNDAGISFLEEGIAMYFTVDIEEYFPDSSQHEGGYFLLMFSDGDGQGEITESMAAHIRKYYQMYEPLPDSSEEVNLELFYKSCGLASLLHKDENVTSGFIGRSVDTRRGWGFETAEERKIDSDGGDLTYPEAYIFTQYLIKNYGAPTVADVVTKKQTFEQGFEAGYEEKFMQFMEYIQEIY